MNKGQLAAKKVYDFCGMITPFDIPLEDVVLARGANVKRGIIKGAEGRILFSDNSAMITVSDKINYQPRLNFILAHELGHFELHRDRAKLYSDNNKTLHEWFKKGSQESEANQFAAEFLMPENIFRGQCDSNFNPKIIEALSDYFKTSLIATAIRYADLNIFPVCIFYCIDGIVQWFHPSENFPYWCRELTQLKVPSGSVAAEFFNDGTTYKADDLQDIEAFEWLDDKKIDKEKLIFEHCFTSKNYNSTLSILWED